MGSNPRRKDSPSLSSSGSIRWCSPKVPRKSPIEKLQENLRKLQQKQDDFEIQPLNDVPSSRNQKDTTGTENTSHASTKESLSSSSEEPTTSPAICILYGFINAAIVLPILMSFGSIIYRDAAFRPYLSTLVKLTTISGIVHQLCFCAFSTLPFAVGQVQDAGLIFLAKMASDIVTYCHTHGYSDEHILATATIGLSICTAILGLALVLVGKCGLASYVQKLPTTVVGGYLAFIGFFCGQSGMALMAEVEVKDLTDWSEFFTLRAFMLMLPGILGGTLITFMVRMLRHIAVIPTCIVSLIVVFYSVLAYTGTSLEEAKDEGWFSETIDPPVWYRTWDYIRFDKVVWAALPQISFTLLGMIFVVALSSSLDIAAVELELGHPLNYDSEIRTVGWSNFISGMTGGYTGSYIFSQTIFNLRAGIRSRLCGFVIAMIELSSVLIPVPILSFLPNFFFGSLLMMIAIDLMEEWLWSVRKNSTSAEYAVTLGTFVLIQILCVEYGILVGLILHFVCAKIGFDMGNLPDDSKNDFVLLNTEGGSTNDCYMYGGMDESVTIQDLQLLNSNSTDENADTDESLLI